jgi:ERCC4-type nuclease
MTTKETVNVIIDANEASQKPELVELLALHEDVEDYKIEPLSEGDFIADDCIFERKTPSDFASSLQEGRLRDQVERMAGTGKTPFILVEGNMGDFDGLEHTDIGSKSLRGMDASIEMKNNIGVKYCSCIEYVADMGIRLARKEKESVETVQARQTEAIKDTSFLEDVFLAINGVGVKTAEKLALRFENLSDVCSANQREFEETDGVGPALSKEIYQNVHNTDSSDNTDDSTERRTYTI